MKGGGERMVGIEEELDEKGRVRIWLKYINVGVWYF